MNPSTKNRINQLKAGQIPTGYKETEIGIVPTDWEVKKIIDIAQVNPKSPELKNEFLYIDLESVVEGKLVQRNVIKKQEAPSRAQRVLEKNDIIFQLVRPYQQNNFLYSTENTLQVVASTGYAQVRTDDFGYVYQYLNFPIFCQRVLEKCTGTNYPAINSSDFSNLFIALPNKKEMNKIAAILTKWDEAIELQEQLIKKLELQKKGLMGKLLKPKKDWQKDKIKNIFQITRGQVLSVNNCNNSYTYPVYSSQTQNDGLMGYYKDYLYENAITWTTDGANAGEVRYRSGKFYCTNVCGVLLNTEGYANECFAYLLNLVTKKYVSFVGNPKLMNNVIGEIKISYPPLIMQQKISNIYSKLLDNINLNKQKLALLKQQRKALMQLLLTGIVRVGVKS